MNLEHSLQVARTVLEGRHGFQYVSESWHNAFSQVLQLIQDEEGGQVILVDGPAGSGITTLLRTIVADPIFSGVTVTNNLYDYDVTLIDRVCAAFSLLESSVSQQTVPAYLAEFSFLTAQRVIVIDDLDVFVRNERDFLHVADQIKKLTECRARFCFIVSTRSPWLQQHIKTSSSKLIRIGLKRQLNISSCTEIINYFWRWNNSNFQLKIPMSRSVISLCKDVDFEIDRVIDLLQDLYVLGVLFGKGARKIMDRCISRENMKFEVQSNVYS
ncbi:hypothetical protein [Pseudomonas antarctica]|uniref:hypothetical protein n=1 Tax=Pseudomonas antarctica TaxID=219572 RepID=UPI00345DA3F5